MSMPSFSARSVRGVAALALWIGAAQAAWAQAPDEPAEAGEAESVQAAPAAAPAVEESVEEPAEGDEPRLQAVVRGFYLEMKGGPGYMVLNPSLPPGVDPNNPGVTGDEALGVGGVIALAIGYDIADIFSLQLSGGAFMVDTTRTDYVRDLGVIWGSLGARIALGLSERLHFLIQAGPMVLGADNAVESSELGFGITAATGLEYYVHVRHFSIGFDVQVYMPITPDVRLFLALGPSLKYTF